MPEVDLIADIYEAGAIPSRWPALLDRIARRLAARGGNLIRSTDSGLVVHSSEHMVEISADFDRLGWNRDNSRVGRLIARQPYAGFLSDSDLHTEKELATLPMYVEFLNPRGVAAGSGTMIQGSRDDALIVAIEGFADHAASRAASPYLNALRPHLARAAMLSALVEEGRRRAVIAALEMIGVAAALLDGQGRLREANAAFLTFTGTLLHDKHARIEIVHPAANQTLANALDRLRKGGGGSSMPLRDADGRAIAALHLVPIVRQARDLFPEMSGIVIIADAANRRMPSADLLQMLFDLTPTEAIVARHIAGGAAPGGIAAAMGCSVVTVRSHLKTIFLKTGATRQADLASLLGAFSGFAAS
ncbi:hypothetical protein ASE00_07750 [Sphingomonas sp. Root710]|uniref:helix-turn-helix transcriptional regulator n=1 Tax=Sphingomonas sp. Root710 TaxID=1736594 RepID=UPI0006F99AC9|nr:helix-turn-helix transcriptional regulator [Sphingomonas sp. Root710]KRB86574.1 hypothetical protein ASE00_07750 [Sphingomonas sp. Root710]